MAGARLPPTLRDIVLAVAAAAAAVDVDVEPHLPAGERHPVPERQQRVLQPVHQRLLELSLRDPLGQRGRPPGGYAGLLLVGRCGRVVASRSRVAAKPTSPNAPMTVLGDRVEAAAPASATARP